jgi:single-stranded DNA-specific DHH superfamily exonuclease
MDYKKLREEFNCSRPLYFFHDDPDGLCSFLLLYRYIKEGKGIVVKSHPNVDEKFLKQVDEYHPDKIFILDLAQVDDNFLDNVSIPVVWIDHHLPQEPRGTHYYNPRVAKDNIPVAGICYKAVQQDLWISSVGVVGDWFVPEDLNELQKKFPSLVQHKCKDPGSLLFDTPLGKLARIFSFILKGTTQDAMKAVKVLTRIDSPDEILSQSTDRGRFIYRKFEKINMDYQELLATAASSATEDPFLMFVYPASRMSFTGDLSNELLYRFPGKIVIVGREKNGEVKCSLRSGPKIDMLGMLNKAIQGIKGYGGGHEQACGAVVDVEDFPRFISNLRGELIAHKRQL